MGTNKEVITVRPAQTLTVKDTTRFVSPDAWDVMNATQLAAQCKILDIPCGGSRDERLARLQQFWDNPRKFKQK